MWLMKYYHKIEMVSDQAMEYQRNTHLVHFDITFLRLNTAAVNMLLLCIL